MKRLGERNPGHIGWRALAIGLLLIPVNSLWVIQMEKVRQGPYPTTISLFANVIFILALLVAVNALARRVRPSWTLTQAESLAVYTMVAVGSALAGHDMIPVLVEMLGHPFWFANSENQWAAQFERYLPRDLTVQNHAALAPYYTGNSSLYHWRFLHAWAGPVLWWTSFIVALGIVMMCIAILARNLWVERERLTYPILELPIQMTSPAGSLWRNRLLWAGFALAASIDILNGLHFLYPNVPSINVKHDLVNLKTYFTMKPWTGIDWMPLSFYPFAIGLGYLLPVDLLFSCWFFYLFFKIQMALANAMGWDTPGVPFIREQNYGAYMAIALILFWNGRRYLLEVIKRALGRPSEVDDSDEGFSYRICFVLIALATAYVLWFVVEKLGLALHLALIAVLSYYLISFVITRIRAELGPPVHDQHFSGPDAMLTQAAGTAHFSAQDLTALNWFGWFNRAYRSHPMPLLAEGLKAASVTRASQKRFTHFMMAAFVFGPVAAFWAFLHSAYRYGAATEMTMGTNFGAEAFIRLSGWITNRTQPNAEANSATLAGFVFALILGIVRNRIFGFPFHPIGFAISGSWAMNLVWMPLLIAWAVKTIILRYGGLRSYRAFLPFFLGLILGECLAGCAWSLLGILWGIPTYSFWGG